VHDPTASRSGPRSAVGSGHLLRARHPPPLAMRSPGHGDRQLRKFPECTHCQVEGQSVDRTFRGSGSCLALYWQAVPRLRHSPSSQRKLMPALQMLDRVANVRSLYMQVRPFRALRSARSRLPVHATARFLHAPSSQRYWVPERQLAEPEEYDFPFRSHSLPAPGRFSAQAVPRPLHCPSSHRYWVPDWHAVVPCEYVESLYLQELLPKTDEDDRGRRSHPAMQRAPAAKRTAIFSTIRFSFSVHPTRWFRRARFYASCPNSDFAA
jgi:hypothetical protein